MQEFKGTPGPWVYAANTAFFDVGQDHRKKQPGSVMAVYPSVCIGVPFDQEDDARLIAAAPELLEALREADKTLCALQANVADANKTEPRWDGVWDEIQNQRDAINQVIAKALSTDTTER